jgi:hypothetical protein
MRNGATTATHAIGINMQKIETCGGWATESNVVLNYIPYIVHKVVPTTAAGLVLLCLAYALGRPTADYPPNGEMMANGAPQCVANGHKVIEV